MACLTLTDDEKEALKKDLLDFVHRVSTYDANRGAGEVEILPPVLEQLLTHIS